MKRKRRLKEKSEDETEKEIFKDTSMTKMKLVKLTNPQMNS
jgi:hypothetical protein